MALWAALRRAGPDGVPVAELLAATGMSRPTLYRRLREHAQAGRVVQTVRGSWRAIEAGRPWGRPATRPARIATATATRATATAPATPQRSRPVTAGRAVVVSRLARAYA